MADDDNNEKAEMEKLAEAIFDDLVDRGDLVQLGPDSVTEAKFFFARSGWTPASCLLAIKSKRRKRVAGYAHIGLFIHCARGRWVVTHFTTGRKLAGFIGPQAAKLAILFAETSAKLIDWEDIRSLKDWDDVRTPELVEEIHQAFEAVTSTPDEPVLH
jgi:hypothetical protein